MDRRANRAEPRRWTDPERFDGAPFEGEGPAPGRYLPLLLGPHACLGMRFAIVQMLLSPRWRAPCPGGSAPHRAWT